MRVTSITSIFEAGIDHIRQSLRDHVITASNLHAVAVPVTTWALAPRRTDQVQGGHSASLVPGLLRTVARSLANPGGRFVGSERHFAQPLVAESIPGTWSWLP